MPTWKPSKGGWAIPSEIHRPTENPDSKLEQPVVAHINMSYGIQARLRVLVAIASYGTGNDHYLSEVIREYRSMPFDVDIVVVSNIDKNMPSGVKVVVGLPSKNPWSLPFAHKQILADGLNDYDLFVYSEDDILITEKNIRAFVRLSAVLPEDELAGFFRMEIGPDGRTYYPEVHGRFHWDPQSVKVRDKYTFASFTNEHSACYLLTRRQLQRAIESGGLLVAPHQGRYDMLCTAATDPYTQCGFTKAICISHLDDFLVHHLPNKYLDRLGTESGEVHRQIEALFRIGRNGNPPSPLFKTETKLDSLPFSTYYSKYYYEPVRPDILSLIRDNVRSVLSIGCGWGAAEEWLANKGVRVVSVPLDAVISACAEVRGVEIVNGDFRTVAKALAGQSFDCLLISNALHLVGDPVDLLASFADLAGENAVVIAIVPNRLRLTAIWKSLRGGQQLKDLTSYDQTGVHFTTSRVVRKWFLGAGLRIEKVLNILPSGAQKLSSATLGLVDPLLASEIVAVATRG